MRSRCPADAIILSDVLHYLQPDQQEILLLKCMDALQGDGILLIRDGNCDLKKRHKRTRLTEVFSTRILSFNKTAGLPLHFISGIIIQEMASQQEWIADTWISQSIPQTTFCDHPSCKIL